MGETPHQKAGRTNKQRTLQILFLNCPFKNCDLSCVSWSSLLITQIAFIERTSPKINHSKTNNDNIKEREGQSQVTLAQNKDSLSSVSLSERALLLQNGWGR